MDAKNGHSTGMVIGVGIGMLILGIGGTIAVQMLLEEPQESSSTTMTKAA